MVFQIFQFAGPVLVPLDSRGFVPDRIDIASDPNATNSMAVSVGGQDISRSCAGKFLKYAGHFHVNPRGHALGLGVFKRLILFSKACHETN